MAWNLHTLQEDPAREVTRAARGVGAALIVIGAHEGSRHLLSRRNRCLVQRLMRDPEIPLLVVPHDAGAASRAGLEQPLR